MATPTFARGAEPLVLATAEAYPQNTYTQQEFLDAFLERYPMDEASAAFARRVFPSSLIEHGSSALPRERLFEHMSRAQFVEYVRAVTEELSLAACRDALEAWGGDKADITHLVFGTMSAVIDAPTTDNRIINKLGLPTTVRRLAVQQMGCLTGFRCLSLAAELAAANPAARVLVVVADVRSGLQNQLPGSGAGAAGAAGGVHTPSRTCIISCALFRDAASAAVVGAAARPGEAPRARVVRTASHFVPGTLSYVEIKDAGCDAISWHNSKDLPEVVSGAVPGLVGRLLDGTGKDARAAAYAMHPGGPKILKLTADRLGVGDGAFTVSWGFLAAHGNTSGSSNLALLHNELKRGEHRQAGAGGGGEGGSPAAAARDIICIGIGPGLALEGLLLERCGPAPAPAAAAPAAPLSTGRRASLPLPPPVARAGSGCCAQAVLAAAGRAASAGRVDMSLTLDMLA